MLPIKKIQSGDTIGIFSSSSPTNRNSLMQIEEYFNLKGYKVKIAPHALDSLGYMAGSPQNRADDLNNLIADDEVKIIMTAGGGKSALQLLPYIDYDLIRKKQKGIIGLSDPAILLNAITSISEVITLHGPNGYNFGETTISKFSEENWWKIVTGEIEKTNTIYLGDSAKAIKGTSEISGVLYGGHLSTIRNLLCTKWEPNLNSSILFLEEAFSDISLIDSTLTYLNYCGGLEKINGLIFGKLELCSESNYDVIEHFEDIILRNCQDYSFPIICDALIGHTDEKVTLPIGAKVTLSLTQRNIILNGKIVF